MLRFVEIKFEVSNVAKKAIIKYDDAEAIAQAIRKMPRESGIASEKCPTTKTKANDSKYGGADNI